VPLPQAVIASVRTYTGNAVRHQRAGSLLAADVDRLTGRTYVVWEDSYYRTDAANDAVLSWSDDGIRWSTPVRVNRGPGNDNVDHYNPSVATHVDGSVDVIWRQRKETASNDVTTYSTDVDTYLARSHDLGKTFGAPVKIDLAPSDTRFGAFSRNGLFQGDYDQVATAGGLTYVVRSESYAPSARAVAPEVPSATTLHHQTTRVAVLGTAGPTTVVRPPTKTPVATPVTSPGGSGLAATGGRPLLAGLGLLLLVAVAVRRRTS
jgi:hypothetical protein